MVDLKDKAGIINTDGGRQSLSNSFRTEQKLLEAENQRKLPKRNILPSKFAGENKIAILRINGAIHYRTRERHSGYVNDTENKFPV